jgi:hypothetical protein
MGLWPRHRSLGLPLRELAAAAGLGPEFPQRAESWQAGLYRLT